MIYNSRNLLVFIDLSQYKQLKFKSTIVEIY